MLLHEVKAGMTHAERRAHLRNLSVEGDLSKGVARTAQGPVNPQDASPQHAS